MTKWQLELIKLYCNVCEIYNSTIQTVAQRLSNNFRPQFSDEECITIYLWGIFQRKFTVKAVYEYTKMHLSDWFPTLPSYQAFNQRINFLAPARQALAEALMCQIPLQSDVTSHLLDSMPIVVAKGSRSSTAKVAAELCDKSYCSSQKMWYYGVKLHSLGQKRFEALPLPVCMQISRASDNDLTVAKQILPYHRNMEIFADKVYRSAVWEEELETCNDIRIHTPVKLKKGQKELCSEDKLFSRAVSRSRQAIEAFFAWMQDKTQIHIASKVRSLSGLLAFLFARIAAACLFILGWFYP